MARKSKNNLSPLPGSKDEYWNEAKKYSIDLSETRKNDCKHYFVVDVGRSAKCKDCGSGFFLDIGEYVKNGHLYRNDELII